MQDAAPGSTARRDIFICHASEDKAEVARPLAAALRRRGLEVWIDEQELRIGDSLLRKIDDGLESSTFGVVILSPNFFGKSWPRRELDGLTTRELSGNDVVVLPVWHNVDASYVRSFSPPLADKVAAATSDGLEAVADQIQARVRPLTDPPPLPPPGRQWWNKWWPFAVAALVMLVGGIGIALTGGGGGGGNPPPTSTTTQPAPSRAMPSDAIRDTFDVDEQGWKAILGAEVEHKGTGGNPGGYLSATDNLAQNTWFWEAPPRYLGNHSPFLGRTLTFDQRQSLSGNPFDAADVWLSGNGVQLVFEAAQDPGPDWTSYTVRLDGGAGWRKVTPTGNVSATEDDMRLALANLAYLRIRGEFEVGFDVGGLDNVVFGA